MKNIIEDESFMEIPHISLKDKYLLNRQTAYNKSLIQGSGGCGCFHCGSIFEESDIGEWILEEDGEDTALCPYCGIDAVIVGTIELPLSTALLSQLFMEWFSSEYEELQKKATKMPSFSDCDDCLRKGAPFRLGCGGEEIVGEINLWVDSVFNSVWNKEFHDEMPVKEDDISLSNAGGIVCVRAYFDGDGSYVCEIEDASGRLLPYKPWSGTAQDLLLKLTQQYGGKLKGIISNGGFGCQMRLFVDR